MIGLTRTDGEHCRLNPDDVQRVEGHPSTVVHLTDGAKYAVLESVDDVVRAVRDHHAAVLSALYQLVSDPDGALEVSALTAGAHRPSVMPVPSEV